MHRAPRARVRLTRPIAAAFTLVTTLAASADAAKGEAARNVPPRPGSHMWMPVRITERGHAAAYDGWGDTTQSRIFHGAIPHAITDRYAVARTWQGGLRHTKEVSTFIRNRRTKKVVGEIRWTRGVEGVTLIRKGRPDVAFAATEAALQGFFTEDVPGFADAAKTVADNATVLYESFQTPAYWGPGHGGYQTRYQGTLRTQGSAILFRDSRGRRDHAVQLTDALGPGEHTIQLRVGDVIGTGGRQPYSYRGHDNYLVYAQTRGQGNVPALQLFRPDRAGTWNLKLILPGGERQTLNVVTQ